ncbi:MAG TPA: two-component system response regulator [Gammaproteobacteria bacterium]|nr:two-component system response regulator [Gammaproteobacteria bacterium]HBF07709.1 two-component system response regulator [Gammaproteobacteria bacterium]HCK93090.1 two-component system response regulator [Gammaproteobacteria bacterium]|tara:strand:+ start:704 stop:1171 length:468 start_codon:yes stop_codon:yes gene_type:complete
MEQVQSQDYRKPEFEIMEIILTDDDDEDLYLTKEAAEIAGIHAAFKTLHSGEELCDYLNIKADSQDTPYKCIAMVDINMPGIGGLKALEKIKNNPKTKHIPVIIYSTSSSQKDIDKAYQLGANSYLVKPVEFQGLVDLMYRFNGYWVELVTLKKN